MHVELFLKFWVKPRFITKNSNRKKRKAKLIDFEIGFTVHKE